MRTFEASAWEVPTGVAVDWVAFEPLDYFLFRLIVREKLNQGASHFFASSRAPYRIQNPFERQNTPQNTPRTPSRNQIRKKYEKCTKIGGFRIFSYFFCILVSGEDSGCILGCILGFRGVLYFVGGFPLFSGKVKIVSQTLSGLFLVGAVNRPRKRKRTNRENPRRVPRQIGTFPKKSGKSEKGQKRTKKEGQVQIGKPPRLNHPRLAAFELFMFAFALFRSLRGPGTYWRPG